MIKLKQLLTEKTVRLSTMKDANFVPGQFVQLMGKKGMVKLDKKSVHKLAKIVRTQFGKGKGMGWSFTSEGKLNEFNKAHFLDLIEQEIESLKGQIEYAKKVLSGRYGSVEDWEKKEIKAVLKDNIKDLKATEKRYKFVQSMKEGKLNEFDGSSKVVRLPNGIKVKIEFDGLTFIGGTKPVFLDRTEMMTFFKATARYLK